MSDGSRRKVDTARRVLTRYTTAFAIASFSLIGILLLIGLGLDANTVENEVGAAPSRAITCAPGAFVSTRFSSDATIVALVNAQGVVRIGTVYNGSRVWDQAETPLTPNVADGSGVFTVLWPLSDVELSCA